MTLTEFTSSVRNNAIVLENTSKPKIDEVPQKQHIEISFLRTIRVPDNSQVSKLPPGFGRFPLHNIKDYAHRLPQDMVDKGGLFFPMHQKEAMWINFKATAPFMVKIYTGRINAISGEHVSEGESSLKRTQVLKDAGQNLQDYVVVPKQLWLDGVSIEPGVVRQFVAMPTGQGYTVEAQLTGQEVNGGLQFEITPAKVEPRKRLSPYHNYKLPPANEDLDLNIKTLMGEALKVKSSSSDTVEHVMLRIQDVLGIPPDQQRLICKGRQLEDPKTLSEYNIQSGDTIYLALSLRGGGTIENAPQMGLAAGGKIEQEIQKDTHDPKKWFKGLTFAISVQILNSSAFRRVTGTEPPACPLTARQYADAGLPFFNMFEEPSGISGTDAFSALKSVNEIEQEKGIVSEVEEVVHTGVMELRKQDRTAHWWDKSRFDVRDEDGLINPNGPFMELRTVADLELRLKNKK